MVQRPAKMVALGAQKSERAVVVRPATSLEMLGLGSGEWAVGWAGG